MKMEHPVTIQEVENGYVVRVGCMLFAFESWSSLLAELNAYAEGKETSLSTRVKSQLPQFMQQASSPTRSGLPSVGKWHMSEKEGFAEQTI